jgi:hypothetical protein
VHHLDVVPAASIANIHHTGSIVHLALCFAHKHKWFGVLDS